MRSAGAVRRTTGVVVAAAFGYAAVLSGCAGQASPGAGDPSAGGTVAGGPATDSPSANGSSDSTDSPTTTDPSDPGDQAAPTVGLLMTHAIANARAAKSVRINGRLLVNGRSSAVQAEGQINGPNQRLIMSGRSWGTFEARAVKGIWYLKGDRAFYTASKNPHAAALAGTWTTLTRAQVNSIRGSTVGGLLNVLLANKDLAALSESDMPARIVTYQGRPAFSIGAQLTSDGSEIIINGRSPLQFLEVRSGPQQGVRLMFSLWDAVPAVPAPPTTAQATR